MPREEDVSQGYGGYGGGRSLSPSRSGGSGWNLPSGRFGGLLGRLGQRRGMLGNSIYQGNPNLSQFGGGYMPPIAQQGPPPQNIQELYARYGGQQPGQNRFNQGVAPWRAF